MEANPEDLSFEKICAYKSLGINRISIGVESLNETDLKTIRRTHTAHQAIKAIEESKRAGIDNISIDLMYDLPNQTIESWEKTVQLATKLPITHLSLYNMTIEEPSYYFKHRDKITAQMPQDEDSLTMLNYAVDELESSGLKRYEISAFCRDGLISNHNIGYWIGRPFIGLGPSAWSYCNGERYRNIGNLKKWIEEIENNKPTIDYTEKLDYPNNINELFAIRLRLIDGADIKDFPSLSDETMSKLEKMVVENYLSKQGSSFSLTKMGRLFYNDVASEIV